MVVMALLATILKMISRLMEKSAKTKIVSVTNDSQKFLKKSCVANFITLKVDDIFKLVYPKGVPSGLVNWFIPKGPLRGLFIDKLFGRKRPATLQATLVTLVAVLH